MIGGGCLCGSVRYEADAIQQAFRACHCTLCRKWSGHFWAAFHVRDEDFRLLSDAGLTWFASSDHASRGFCAKCGSSLFFRLTDAEGIEVAAGSADSTDGARLVGHTHVAFKGDYYDLNDGLTQSAE